MEVDIIDDPIAARGEALLRMCLAAQQIKDPDTRAVLIKGVERVIASIPIATTGQATVTTVPNGKSRL